MTTFSTPAVHVGSRLIVCEAVDAVRLAAIILVRLVLEAAIMAKWLDVIDCNAVPQRRHVRLPTRVSNRRKETGPGIADRSNGAVPKFRLCW